MRTWQILALILYAVAAICAALARRHGELLPAAVALIAAGLAVELVPAAFQIT